MFCVAVITTNFYRGDLDLNFFNQLNEVTERYDTVMIDKDVCIFPRMNFEDGEYVIQ